MTNAKHVILDSVKNHLIPYITEKKTDKEIFDALVILYQNRITDNVASYLIEIIKSRDQPATVGEEVKSEELISIALNGLSSSWQPFL